MQRGGRLQLIMAEFPFSSAFRNPTSDIRLSIHFPVSNRQDASLNRDGEHHADAEGNHPDAADDSCHNGQREEGPKVGFHRLNAFH